MSKTAAISKRSITQRLLLQGPVLDRKQGLKALKQGKEEVEESESESESDLSESDSDLEEEDKAILKGMQVHSCFSFSVSLPGDN